jgi:hypothetical protein
MEEPVPGIWRWSATHPNTGMLADSHFHEPSRTLIDPMIPDEGLDWFVSREPERIVLTNRHHYRESGELAARFGCPVLCNVAGLHEFEGTGRAVEGFEPECGLADGITAIQIGAICPDETALQIEAGPGALAVADGVHHYGKALGFFPDGLLGDDPEAVKRGLRAAYRAVLDREFDALLFAHGDPIAAGGKAALREFAEER